VSADQYDSFLRLFHFSISGDGKPEAPRIVTYLSAGMITPIFMQMIKRDVFNIMFFGESRKLD
jgi:hypothetical protein